MRCRRRSASRPPGGWGRPETGLAPSARARMRGATWLASALPFSPVGARCLSVFAVASVSLILAGAGSARTLDAGKPKLAITKGAQAWANRINLKLGDFGPGWRAERNKSDDNSSKCFARDLSSLTLNGRASSPDFVKGNVPYAASLAAVFATAPQARKAFGALRQALDDCLVSEIDKDSNFEDSSGGALNFPHLGERSFAFQVATHAKEGKLSVSMRILLAMCARWR
jgi:hypothetical protein